jgi:hypothetical protein
MALEVAMDLLSPLFLVLIITLPDVTPTQLTDFSRFAKVPGEEIAVVDVFGAESLGRVIAATDTSVTLGLRAGSHTFHRADLLSADRLRDGTSDGLIRGLAIGVLSSWAASREQGLTFREFAVSVSVSGAVGYLLDRSSSERAPLYRK